MGLIVNYADKLSCASDMFYVDDNLQVWTEHSSVSVADILMSVIKKSVYDISKTEYSKILKNKNIFINNDVVCLSDTKHKSILEKISKQIISQVNINGEKIYKSYQYVLDIDDDFIVDESSVLESLNILIRIMKAQRNISVPNITISEKGLVSLNWEIDRFNLFTITVETSILNKCVLSYKPFLKKKKIYFFDFASVNNLFENMNFSVILKIMKKSKL